MSKKSKKLSSIVGAVAPKLGKVLGFFGVPGAEVGGELLGKLGEKFGVPDAEPDKLAEAIAQDPNAALKLKEFEISQEIELNRILADQSVALEQEETKQMATVNETMRAELVSTSIFKSGWRPFNGWILGVNTLIFTISIVALAFIAVLTKNAEAMLMIPNLIAAYSIITGTQCAVVGVSAHSRGVEKLAKMGVEKPGILQALKIGLKK